MRAIHRFEQVAVDGFFARLFEPVGEVGTRTAFVDEAPHGLSGDNRRILGILIIRKVPAGTVERELANVRRKDFRVALARQFLGNEILKLLADYGAVG